MQAAPADGQPSGARGSDPDHKSCELASRAAKGTGPGRRKRTGPRNSCRPLSTDRARLEILHDLVKLLCKRHRWWHSETVTPCAIGLAYFWRKVPETKGRSLEEIERDLAVDPGAVESVPVRH